jgi:hypothetical protein
MYPSSIGTFLLLENKKLANQMQEYKDEITQTKELKQKAMDDLKQEEKLAAQIKAKPPRKTVKKAPKKIK